MLTRRQRDILAYIAAYLDANNGVSPSFDEIRSFFGIASRGVIHRHLTALEERGAIRRLKGRARAIEIIPEAERQLHCCPACEKPIPPSALVCPNCETPLTTGKPMPALGFPFLSHRTQAEIAADEAAAA